MTTIKFELAKECSRQCLNCLYSAASIYIWLRWLRGLKVFFTIAPIIFGAVGSAKILSNSNDPTMKVLGAIASLLGGILSTIYAPLKLETHITEAKAAAGEYTNLRDAFRQAGQIYAKKPIEEFEEDFVKLRTRLEKVRSLGVTAPEFCFWLAKRKINEGDYSFRIDEE